MNLNALNQIDTVESITAWHSISNRVVDDKIDTAIRLVMEEYKELMQAFYTGEANVPHVMHEAADLIFVLINFMYVHDYIPSSVLKAVTLANYGKFFNKETLDTHRAEIEQHCIEKNLTLKEITKDIYCLMDEHYKIKKGIFYKGVNYNDFLMLKK